MSDLRGFGRRARQTGRAVEQNATLLVRRVAVAVDAAVVLATPVDTGRARSNWQTEIGGPATGTLPEPSSPAAGAQRSLNAAAAAVASTRPGDTVHITNNLPYIGSLNDGTSAQAPSGFVQEAVLAGAAQVRSASVLVTRGGGGA